MARWECLTLAMGDVDGFLDLALLEEAGHLGRVLAGLLGGLGERPVALDHDADGVDRHDEELMTVPQATPPMCSIMDLKSNCIASSWTVMLVLAALLESRKLTVTVMMTGTGTPFRRVGV